MTRINANIPPENLTDQHLLAELRELPRVPNTVSRMAPGFLKSLELPNEFCLGEGHVKFFYNKMPFLKDRYNSLINEAEVRGFNVKYFPHLFNFSFGEETEDFKNQEQANELIKVRIAERILNSNQQSRYYREQIDKHYYINKILNYKLKTV